MFLFLTKFYSSTCSSVSLSLSHSPNKIVSFKWCWMGGGRKWLQEKYKISLMSVFIFTSLSILVLFYLLFFFCSLRLGWRLGGDSSVRPSTSPKQAVVTIKSKGTVFPVAVWAWRFEESALVVRTHTNILWKFLKKKKSLISIKTPDFCTQIGKLDLSTILEKKVWNYCFILKSLFCIFIITFDKEEYRLHICLCVFHLCCLQFHLENLFSRKPKLNSFKVTSKEHHLSWEILEERLHLFLLILLVLGMMTHFFCFK